MGGVEQHIDYIGREGRLGLEADTGEHLDGKGFERQLTEDWDLDLESGIKCRSQFPVRFSPPPAHGPHRGAPCNPGRSGESEPRRCDRR